MSLFGIIFFAVAANILYTGGWFAEVLLWAVAGALIEDSRPTPGAGVDCSCWQCARARSFKFTRRCGFN